MHLAFVPVDSAVEYYLLIKNMILLEYEEERAKYTTFLITLEKNWIEKFDIEQKIIKEPRVPIKFWNAYEGIQGNLPRTSNAAESWNRTLNLRTEVAHPNIAQFINELLTGEEGHRFNIIRAGNGIFTVTKENTVRERCISICIDNFSVFNLLIT